MNKKVISLCLAGVFTLLMASCGSSGSALLEGYDFSGDGILGKIPMGKAIQIATAREICYDLQEQENKLTDKKITEMSKEEYMELGKKANELAQKADEKYNHCLDDVQDDLKADSARLLALKGISWEDKTNCGFQLKEVQLVEQHKTYLDTPNIVFFYEANDTKVKALPLHTAYYVFLDKTGKMLLHNNMQVVGENRYKFDFGLDISTKKWNDLITLASSAEKYHLAMTHCLRLDSISKVLIVDADAMLDYISKMTLTGVGPVQLGADLKNLPQSLEGVYDKYYGEQAPDGDNYYQFETRLGTSMFTAIGTPEGKIKCIEVCTELLPIKFGNIVLRVEDPYSKIIERYNKQISWS